MTLQEFKKIESILGRDKITNIILDGLYKNNYIKNPPVDFAIEYSAVTIIIALDCLDVIETGSFKVRPYFKSFEFGKSDEPLFADIQREYRKHKIKHLNL